MAVCFREQHLEAFQTMATPGIWKVRTASDWLESAQIERINEPASSRPLSRDFLRSLCSDKRISDRDLLWSILAWGGMKRDAARRLAKNEDRWTKIVGTLRGNGLNRAASYELCSNAVHEFPAGGIGPAYFTKLIFFANPRHDGYIMDQWTSRSVNLLVDGPALVRMRTKDHVDPRNSAGTYEAFCQVVEQLSSLLLARTPEETEQCLFSTGGKKRAPWRRYLIDEGG
jgi:hypothetical protein